MTLLHVAQQWNRANSVFVNKCDRNSKLRFVDAPLSTIDSRTFRLFYMKLSGKCHATKLGIIRQTAKHHRATRLAATPACIKVQCIFHLQFTDTDRAFRRNLIAASQRPLYVPRLTIYSKSSRIQRHVQRRCRIIRALTAKGSLPYRIVPRLRQNHSLLR